MNKEEINNRLVRLNYIVHEAKEIVKQLEEHVNGRILADLPDVTIEDLMEGASTVAVRFVNAAHAKGVYNVKDLMLYTQKQVLNWCNIGAGSVIEVRRRLRDRFGIEWE